MALGKDYSTQQCSIASALEVVGERWTLLVVRDAFYGVRRYNDFLSHLGMPRAVLATRLKSLEQAGILTKRRYQQSPPRDEYVLTERGIALWPTLRSLGLWGREHVEGGPRCACSRTPPAGPNWAPTVSARPAARPYRRATWRCGRDPGSIRTRTIR